MMGKVAIVTGGTRGIGEAICIALKDAGFKVAANYAGNAERAKGFTERTGIPAYQWDVADHAACLEGCAKVAADLGPIDVVVNNAGITRDGTLLKMSYEAWKEVIDTNLGGCFNMAKATFAGMKDRGWGRIVNIGSINGQAGQYGQVNYAAAKSGIHGFTKALAQEGAKYGVTVNAIAPAALTRMTENLGFGQRAKEVEVGQFDPFAAENISPLVVWLGSTESAEVTGRVFNVAGGRISIADGWRRGAEQDKGERWNPAELGSVIEQILGEAAPNETLGA